MDFINSLFGGTGGNIIAGFLALAIVIGLIILAVWALKFVLDMAGTVARTRNKRLDIVENLAIDQKRQLILIKRDDVEHLILVGGENELVIEAGIKTDSQANAQPAANIANETKKQTSKAKKDNQKTMSKLSKKLDKSLASKVIKEKQKIDASVEDISLRHTGLLRRNSDVK